jgi:Zn-dependent protease
MNFFEQGIPLGRWFGISVVIHWTFLLYAGNELLHADKAEGGVAFTAMYIALLFATVLLHEFGHALSCKAVGGVALHIVLWPLGGIAFVQPPMKPWAWLVTTVCGPLVNAILWPASWVIFYYVLPQLPLNPGSAGTEFLVTAVYLMMHINRVLLLFNLIPAYPMDGGRILQEILWLIVGYPRSLMIAGMVGTVAGGAFVVLGLGATELHIPYIDFTLGHKGQVDVLFAVIGLLCMMQSFGIYRRSQEIAGWRKN